MICFRYCIVSSSISFWLPSAGIVYFYYEVRDRNHNVTSILTSRLHGTEAGGHLWRNGIIYTLTGLSVFKWTVTFRKGFTQSSRLHIQWYIVVIVEHKLSISDYKVRHWEVPRGCQGEEVHLLSQLGHDAVLQHQRRQLRAPGEVHHDNDNDDDDNVDDDDDDRLCWSQSPPWPRALQAPCPRGQWPGLSPGQ